MWLAGVSDCLNKPTVRGTKQPAPGPFVVKLEFDLKSPPCSCGIFICSVAALLHLSRASCGRRLSHDSHYKHGLLTAQSLSNKSSLVMSLTTSTHWQKRQSVCSFTAKPTTPVSTQKHLAAGYFMAHRTRTACGGPIKFVLHQQSADWAASDNRAMGKRNQRRPAHRMGRPPSESMFGTNAQSIG